MLKVGEKFILTEDAVSNYGEEYREKVLTVEHVSTSEEDSRFYDESMDGMALYDIEGEHFAVYEYEIEEV